MQRISKNWFLSQNFLFLWISIDESLASKYEVLAAPTFVAFNKGAETGRIAGKTTKDALLGLFDGLV